jgi:PERQ amino acid-rich with GYF domain-containing protein
MPSSAMLVRNGTSEVVPPYSTAKPSFFMRACATDTAPGAHTTSDQLPDANTFIHRARRPNGATQTFRRTSNAVNTTNTVSQNHENIASPAASSQPPRYVPPHRNGTVTDPRYSKSQLLDLYRLQQSTDDGLQDDLQNLYIGNWQPNGQNGAPAAGWGRNDASREQPSGPDVCWDDDGAYEPLALTEMDNEEKEVRTWRS